jgi:class 3 adenylate cyclase
MAADRLGAAQQALADICDGHLQKSESKSRSESKSESRGKDRVYAVHSSVYGRFLCVEKPRVAVDTATAVLDEAARRGVRLAVGIDQGRLAWVQDVGHDNLIGPPINRAARLAAWAEAKGLPPILSPRARDSVHGAVDAYRDKLGGLEQGEGKHGEIIPFHTFCHEAPLVGKLDVPAGLAAQSVHALVYDVARFSDKDPEQAWLVLTQLRDTVVRILHNTGNLDAMGWGRVWYAPAGDGGVIAFSSGVTGDVALDVAETLAERCRGKQEIRIGLATGPAVVIGGYVPVGPGILRADALSNLPDTGNLCVDRTFWNDRRPADRDRWVVRDHEGDADHPRDPEALLLFPPGVPPPGGRAASRAGAPGGPIPPGGRAASRASAPGGRISPGGRSSC